MTPSSPDRRDDPNPHPEPVPLEINGVLDLHGFKPAEVGDLVVEYLAACGERGITEVRLIHGKGIGNLMRTVHARLKNHPSVVRFSLATPLHGGAGATIVVLAKPNP